jgi:GH35 family endo-1,4-beta-xylanase
MPWRRFGAAVILPAAAAACLAGAVCAWYLWLSPGSGASPMPDGARLCPFRELANPARLSGGGLASVSLRPVSAPFLPFGEVLSVKVSAPSPQPYNVQLSLPTAAPVRAGDMLAARFYVRRPAWSNPAARLDFVFERAGGDYRKSALLPVAAGLRWRRVDLLFPAAASYPSGGANVNFRLGFGAQELELAGFSLVNCGRGGSGYAGFAAGVKGYEGREPGAPWRAAAARRIDSLRKGRAEVRVVDAAGRPVGGASVRLLQTSHAFKFGSAISSKYLYAENREDDKARYRALFLRLFNSATIENDLKWFYWAGERRAWADATAGWLAKNSIELRGHTLVWPGWEHMPPGVAALAKDPEKLRAAIKAHITEEAAYYKGRAAEWDVLNEPLDHREVEALLGPAETAAWFKYARAADPAARLFVNEYGILDDGGLDAARQDRYEKYISALLAAGAPVDGIGLQCHFGMDLTPPERLLAILDRYAKLGKPVRATEFDIAAADEQLQADYLRDFLTVMFSHPAVEGVTLWGFWEGVHSEPLPALYRKDWSKKKAALQLEDLLLKEWRSDISGASGKDGIFSERAFYGKYEVSAAFGGKKGSVKADILPGSGPVTVVLR